MPDQEADWPALDARRDDAANYRRLVALDVPEYDAIRAQVRALENLAECHEKNHEGALVLLEKERQRVADLERALEKHEPRLMSEWFCKGWMASEDYYGVEPHDDAMSVGEQAALRAALAGKDKLPDWKDLRGIYADPDAAHGHARPIHGGEESERERIEREEL